MMNQFKEIKQMLPVNESVQFSILPQPTQKNP